MRRRDEVIDTSRSILLLVLMGFSVLKCYSFSSIGCRSPVYFPTKRSFVRLHSLKYTFNETQVLPTQPEIRIADSLDLFEADITVVLRDLRSSKVDPTIPAYFSGTALSFTNYWDLRDWEIHTSRWRYLRYIIKFYKSRLLRRVLPMLSVLLIWSFLVLFVQLRYALLDKFHVPLNSLSLVSTFVAALQTLRSNQGLSRLKEGRLAGGKMVLLTRDTALLFATYVYPKDKNLGLLAARALAQFGWSYKAHLRDTGGIDTLRAVFTSRDEQFYQYVANQRKKPVALLFILRKIMADMAERNLIGTTEHRLIEDNIRRLDSVITTGERIRSTPIPPLYSGHSTRLMLMYLGFLPMALFGMHLNRAVAISITIIVGFALFGLDEISHIFEQPFRFMPLYQLAKISMIDVADAFLRQPPPLRPSAQEFTVEPKPVPSYWQYVRGTLPYGGMEDTT